MLVRFDSDAGNIIMFGDIAVKLLKLMGQSGEMPGAILAPDIPAALERLKRGVAAAPAQVPAKAKEEEKETQATGPAVSVRQRAFPLMELLSRAATKGCPVMWTADPPR